VRTFVKICGLRDVESVAAAVAAGADAVGFVFAESVRRLGPGQARSIASALPAGVQRVAVMRHPSNAEWLEVLNTFAPDILQTDVEDFESLEVPSDIVRWPVIREGSNAAKGALPDVFIYEGRHSGVGETVDWSRAARLANRGHMILAGGLAPDNVATAIAAAKPWGVDVSSGVESQPGHKDIELIRAFIGAVRAVEKD
jgi:phosphoribosylanthranilate isomerase